MVSLDLTLTLPDDIAQEAKKRGLLTPEAVERLINAELERQQRGAYFFAVADRLGTLDEPPMSEDEIQAEIDAYRAEKRAAGAHRR